LILTSGNDEAGYADYTKVILGAVYSFWQNYLVLFLRQDQIIAYKIYSNEKRDFY
jgi:hypothetical protein